MTGKEHGQLRFPIASAPLHPLLLAAYPVLFLYSRNLSMLAFEDVADTLALSVSIVAALLVGLWLVLKRIDRAAIALSAFVILFFSYGLLWTFVHRYTSFPVTVLWSLLVTAALWASLRGKYDARVAAQALNLVGVALLVMTGLTVVGFERGNRAALSDVLLRAQAATSRGRLTASPDGLPEIYFIVLDSYVRPDVAKDLYGLDLSDFVGFLESRGFYVARRARSNYAHTTMSVASSLNMQYLNGLTTTYGRSSSDLRPLFDLIANNAVCRQLKSLGYKVVFYPSAYPVLDSFPADERSATTEGVARDLFLEQFTAWTPLRSVEAAVDAGGARLAAVAPRGRVSPNEAVYGPHRQRSLEALEGLGRERGGGRPLFVFTHLDVLHTPFVFGNRGVDDPINAMLTNVQVPRSDVVAAYPQAYAEQVRYLNRRLAEVVDRILGRPGPRPIIILQADHGAGVWRSEEDCHKMDPRERMSIFSAFYLPNGGGRALYPAISPVNNFGVIFDAYFGGDYKLLPDESYIGWSDRPYDLTECRGDGR